MDEDDNSSKRKIHVTSPKIYPTPHTIKTIDFDYFFHENNLYSNGHEELGEIPEFVFPIVHN